MLRLLIKGVEITGNPIEDTVEYAVPLPLHEAVSVGDDPVSDGARELVPLKLVDSV